MGRKKIAMDDRFGTMYSAWKSGKLTATQAMQQLGLKSNTFYRRVAEWEQTKEM